MSNENYVHNTALNEPISYDEIEKVVLKLKAKKACGIDKIPNEVIKCKEIRLTLFSLFNACFRTSIVPSIWGKAIIKPIPKGADKDPYLPLNYRGISLISCLSKAYAAILNNRLVKYANEISIFADEQNGFRSGRSCEDHIFSLNAIIRNRLNDKKSTFCCFVDLEKAFDWINRDMLLFKLLSHNIDGKIYKAIQSLLITTEASIKLSENLQTGWFSNDFGVRQGDSISPTLFSFYINDLVQVLKERCNTVKVGDIVLNSLLYADDMVLISESETGLQNLLNELSNWCYKWHLKVNESKTKVMHFRKINQVQSETIFKYGDAELEKVTSYKYLGVILDENLAYSSCIKALSDSGGRALGAIISKFKALKNVGFKTFETLYNSGIKPILEYGSGIWGHLAAKPMNKVNNRAMRYFLGVHKFSPNEALIGDIGWLTPKLSRYLPRIRLWNKLIEMDNSRLTKRIFEYDYNVCKNNWSNNMKSLFVDINADVFKEKLSCNLSVMNDTLYDMMSKSWAKDVLEKPKLRTYIRYKESVCTEKYVMFLDSRYSRSLFAQFRHGILPLRIETGRYKNLPLEERLCELCNIGAVEDEKHFLCECIIYVKPRTQLYNKVTIINPSFSHFDNEEKLIFLMKKCWKEVSIYIQCAWKIRQNCLYN